MPSAARGDTVRRSLEERYREFHANSGPTFAQYPQVEPLRFFVFKHLLVQGRADGWQDRAKRWLRPVLKRARTRLADRRVDVLVWVETHREVIRDALVPVYHELVARGIATELVSYEGPPDLPATVSAHYLRHAHVSHALDRGAPAHLVQATVGHSDLRTTSRYAHARPNESSSTYLRG